MLKKILFLLLFTFSIFAKEPLSLTTPIIDTVGVVSNSIFNEYNLKLKEYYQQTGIQIQIVIINNLDDETIESYSIKLFDAWKLGNKGSDKGILYLLAIDNRSHRIEVGRGLEGVLTDLKSKHILRDIKHDIVDKNYDGLVKDVVLKIQQESDKERDLVDKIKQISIGTLIIYGIGIIALLMVMSLLIHFLGYDGWIIFRLILEIVIAIISGGKGGWSGGGGGSSGGGSSDKF